jgi:uncharacterized protein (DUF433 family)
VSVHALFDYLNGGHPLADFLADFPTVAKSQVHPLLPGDQCPTSHRAD